jgi:hypothetical protein
MPVPDSEAVVDVVFTACAVSCAKHQVLWRFRLAGMRKFSTQFVQHLLHLIEVSCASDNLLSRWSWCRFVWVKNWVISSYT